MQRLSLVAVLLALALAAGCAPKSDPLPPPVTADPVETYQVVPGDVLSIDGGKNPATTRDVRVDEGGFINLIYLGKVKVAGKTKSQIESEIDTAYEESGYFTDSQVSVTIVTLFYFIDGHVAVRGRKSYIRQITLYQAIVQAGGFTEYANRSKVRVLRPQPDGQVKVYVINCRRIMIGLDPDTFVVRPNDTILVPRGY
jgi:protein involved in polysaccharide export with SLBB domain